MAKRIEPSSSMASALKARELEEDATAAHYEKRGVRLRVPPSTQSFML
jgi:hypothetical protein